MLPPDHPARAAWAFAEGADLAPLYAAIKAVEGRPGHPHIDPRLLFALWLYATLDGVGSARELERLCTDHAAYRWLCGGVSVNYHTLAACRWQGGQFVGRRRAAVNPRQRQVGPPPAEKARDARLPEHWAPQGRRDEQRQQLRVHVAAETLPSGAGWGRGLRVGGRGRLGRYHRPANTGTTG